MFSGTRCSALTMLKPYAVLKFFYHFLGRFLCHDSLFTPNINISFQEKGYFPSFTIEMHSSLENVIILLLILTTTFFFEQQYLWQLSLHHKLPIKSLLAAFILEEKPCNEVHSPLYREAESYMIMQEKIKWTLGQYNTFSSRPTNHWLRLLKWSCGRTILWEDLVPLGLQVFLTW